MEADLGALRFIIFFLRVSGERKSIKPKREKNLRIELIVVGEGHGIETVVEFFVKLELKWQFWLFLGLLLNYLQKWSVIVEN